MHGKSILKYLCKSNAFLLICKLLLTSIGYLPFSNLQRSFTALRCIPQRHIWPLTFLKLINHACNNRLKASGSIIIQTLIQGGATVSSVINFKLAREKGFTIAIKQLRYTLSTPVSLCNQCSFLVGAPVNIIVNHHSKKHDSSQLYNGGRWRQSESG